jgi:alkanesulfonate monooxygenase SsuD/methylene tetrahydromethanopterin reductase-like flavin-dependent oxidoreductase (luciferase family)
VIADEVREALFEVQGCGHAANVAGPVLDADKERAARGVGEGNDGLDHPVGSGEIALELQRLALRAFEQLEQYWSTAEKSQVLQMLARSVVGSPESVRAGLASLVDETHADELIIVSDVYDHAARLRSIELIAHAHMLEPVTA